MSSTSTSTPFVPKQASPKNASIFAEIIGTTSEDITTHILTLLPALPTDAVIHDNGCGTGAVTSTLLASHPTLTIYCTDANAYMVDSIKFPNVQAQVMRAQELSFPDQFFDYSFTTFVVANLDDPHLAARHLYRTLKKGGTAVVATWKSMPHDAPLLAAHAATRGGEKKMKLTWGGEWYLPAKLEEFMLSGGFEKGKLRTETCEVWHKTADLKRWAQILWSFLGEGKGGWSEEDERRWDEAVGVLEREMERSPDCRKVEDGGWELRFVANIAVAVK